MIAQNGAFNNLCVFCSSNSSRLLSTRIAAIRRIPPLNHSFSISSVQNRNRKPNNSLPRITQKTKETFVSREHDSKPPFGNRPRPNHWKTFYEPWKHRKSKKENLIEPQPRPSNRQLEVITQRAILSTIPHPKILADGGYLYGFAPEGTSVEELRERWELFRTDVFASLHPDDFKPLGLGVPSRLKLESTYMQNGFTGMKTLLEESFCVYMGYSVAGDREDRANAMESAADTRFPQEWFTTTRQVQRTWHLHVGPTNSGKTYHALKRLEEAGNGIYAGPLRLLAQEIFERMNSKGIPCNLVTGDDVRIVNGLATVYSSTMEMVDLNKEVDVCVIDEIQMIGDEDRGWAWTQAVLGVRAKELHLCGEERTVELIQRLAASVGDKLIIHRYKRLGPLEVERKSLGGDLKLVQKGDCVVTFSRRNIFALKRSIEEQTGKRCAVIYGTLPPETRSTQARMFNDQDTEYDVLVASDAVGMGLNLSIKRVIFEAVEKWNGTKTVAISIPQLKQIAGRAGRYRVPNVKANGQVEPEETSTSLRSAPQVGYVTTLDAHDLNTIKSALSTDVKPIQTAGILPLGGHIELFASQFPPTKPFSEILREMEEYIRTSDLFHPCSFRESIESAALFDDIPSLTVQDRMVFMMAPIGRDPITRLAVENMAECVAENRDGSIMKIKHMDLECLDKDPTDSAQLQRLESFHKALIVYLWLSYRFPATFTPRETAQELKAICEAKIEKGLQAVKFTRNTRNSRGKRLTNTIAEPLKPESLANPKQDRTELDKHKEKSEIPLIEETFISPAIKEEVVGLL